MTIDTVKSENNYRVVSVTPAGRERYLRILVPYLLQNRDIISEHHFWLNTVNPGDISFIEGLHQEYPDFFKINRKELFKKAAPNECIWQYFIDYTDEGTLYLRFDDDICFIAPGAVKALVERRLAQPEPFLVYGNIINNAICSHIQQKRGMIPVRWGRVLDECMDPNGWDNPRFAERLHNRFLSDIRKGQMNKWLFEDRFVYDYRRFSVNVISWFGRDMKQVPELTCRDLKESGIINPATGNPVDIEEILISEIIPRRLSRPCSICGEALFAHFAFYTQRNYLEKATTLLERYHSLALNNDSRLRNAALANSELLKKTRYRISLILNIFPVSGVRTWHRKLNLNARYKTFIMIKYPGLYSVLRKVKRTLLLSANGSKTPPDQEKP